VRPVISRAAAVDIATFRDHCANTHEKLSYMKASWVSILVLVVASVLAACWIGNEDRRSAHRINVPSHQKHVGLGFRHARNDIAGFTLTDEVLVRRSRRTGKASSRTQNPKSPNSRHDKGAQRWQGDPKLRRSAALQDALRITKPIGRGPSGESSGAIQGLAQQKARDLVCWFPQHKSL
jgi:hypothetical protein